MSVSGKPNDVREGDVYLEIDGYLRAYFKNTNDVWYEIVLSKATDYMWVVEPKTKPYCPDNSRFVMNIKELLLTVRQELQDESSS